MAGEKPAGARLKHGAWRQHFRKRYGDARTKEGRQLREIIKALTQDLGEISAGQAILLDRIKEKIIVLIQIGK
ncbi:MAG: hypothetical protein JRG73_18790 [Deltaproteobacteria bacterium]|nr:hypothetical protein [Deltaproteobacteria bacterium]MBW2308974.1 hypothetical protein [Deltaproteobacteria bacterium]